MKEDDIDGIGEEITTGEYIESEDIPPFSEEENERISEKIKKGVEGFKKQRKKNVTPFSKIPEGLIFDNNVQSSGKIVYAAYFKFSRQKDLDEYPWAFVKQSTLAKHLLLSEDRISKLTQLLEREKWITTIKTGLGFSQIVVLFPAKGKNISEAKKQQIRRMARAVKKQYSSNLKNK